MKKIAIAVLLISITGMILFAEGSQEGTTWEPGMGYPKQNIIEESMSLTGKIDLTDINSPKITVGAETYELMVPYRLDYDIDIADGDEITINGFKVPAYRRTTAPETNNIMVTGATFNGTDYNLNMMNNGPMGYRQGTQMKNNYGPANGRREKFRSCSSRRFPNNSENWGQQSNGMMHRPYGRR